MKYLFLVLFLLQNCCAKSQSRVDSAIVSKVTILRIVPLRTQLTYSFSEVIKNKLREYLRDMDLKKNTNFLLLQTLNEYEFILELHSYKKSKKSNRLDDVLKLTNRFITLDNKKIPIILGSDLEFGDIKQTLSSADHYIHFVKKYINNAVKCEIIKTY